MLVLRLSVSGRVAWDNYTTLESKTGTRRRPITPLMLLRGDIEHSGYSPEYFSVRVDAGVDFSDSLCPAGSILTSPSGCLLDSGNNWAIVD